MGVVLAMSALALTNCAKDEFAAPASSGNGISLKGKIAAAILDTRTTADGLKTFWAAGDKATVFHGDADSLAIVKDGQWTADAAGATTNFSGNVSTNLPLDPEKYYNWYMNYPHKANLTSPDGTGAVFTVGGKIQQQVEFDSRAHMCGDNVPLAGRAMNVKGDAIPEIAMNNLCTALEFVITNKTGEWLRLHAIDFFGPDGEYICGNFNVNFTGDAPVYTPDLTNAANNVAVRINGGAVVLPDASAKVYAAVKPFTAPAGSTLKVRINGYEKTLNVTEPIEFAPGHIRTINVAYDEAAVDYSGTYFIGCTGGDGKMYVAIGKSVIPDPYDKSGGQNHVMLSRGCRFDGNVLYYESDMSIGNESIKLDATIEDYKITLQKVTDDPLYKGMYLIKGIDGMVMYTSDVANGNSVDFADLESLKSQGLDSNAYFNISADGTDGAMYIVATSASMTRRRFGFNYSGGNFPRFTCFNEGTTNANVMLLPIEGCMVDPLPRLIHTADITCSCTGADGEMFEVKTENNDSGWETSVLAVDGTVVTDAFAYGDYITFTAAPNEDTESSKNGWIVVALLDPDGVQNLTDTVNVTVNRMPTMFYTKVTEEKTDWTGKYLVVYENGTSGCALYTDGAGYGDKTATGLPVDIMSQGIPAVYDAIGLCVLDIQPWDGNGGTDMGLDPGEPSWKLMMSGSKAGIGLGIYGNNPASMIAFNNNVSYSRFRNVIHYDAVNSCISISCAANATNGRAVGYLKYDTDHGYFGFTAMTGDAYAPVQLYEYRTEE